MKKKRLADEGYTVGRQRVQIGWWFTGTNEELGSDNLYERFAWIGDVTDDNPLNPRFSGQCTPIYIEETPAQPSQTDRTVESGAFGTEEAVRRLREGYELSSRLRNELVQIIEGLAADKEALALALIEAQNPGIEMDSVRATRAAPSGRSL